MKGETWLTRPLSPDQVEMNRKEQKRRTDAYYIVVKGWLEAYKEGEITFVDLCQSSQRALRSFPEKGRQRFLGEVVEKALAVDPPKRKRGNSGRPTWLRKTSAYIVKAVNEREGAVIRRDTVRGLTAFDRTSTILAEMGIQATPTQIEKWYSEYK